MADTSRVLEDNLGLLNEIDARLVAAIRQSAPDPRFILLTARNGMSVPAVRSPSGTAPLHSLYDPVREAERTADACRGAGCVVVCGLGGGFHVAALLEDRSLHALLLVEKDPGVLRALLRHVDVTPLLRDRRIRLVCGAREASAALSFAWKPALAGALKTAHLRAWCDVEQKFFQDVTTSIQEAVESIRADYSVQSHFGKRWFVNMLHNLPLVRQAPAPPPAHAAAVTAAGPSLDIQIPRLVASRAGSLLIATDTSLPALLGRGIAPDAVLSIDCQVYGYHHFLGGLPRTTTLYLDLASPPLLSRLHSRPVFMASSHPFARYIDSQFVSLPWLDTSGGNVAHASVALARSMGANTITVYGADFSYPQGKAYARGTYLYEHFRAFQGRLAPAESALVSFGFQNTARGPSGTRLIPTTPLLLAYRDRFLHMMETIDADVVPVEGLGLPLTRAPGARHAATRSANPWPAVTSGARPDWRELLRQYVTGLENLGDRLADASDQGLLDTLLPVAARVIKEGGSAGEPAVSEARRWVSERVQRALGGATSDRSAGAHGRTAHG